jgi:Phage integrase family
MTWTVPDLNTRETATLVWVVLALGIAVAIPSLRVIVIDGVKIATKPFVAIMLAATTLLAAAITICLAWFGYWRTAMIPTTVAWFVGTAIVGTFSMGGVGELRRLATRTVAFTAVVVFVSRVMEVLALQWGDIDFTEGVIHVRFQLSRQGKRVPLKTKAAKRDIVMMDTLGKLLRRRRLAEEFSTDTDFVFQSSVPRRPMTYRGALLDLFHDARKNANLEDVTFHCLRHTFASILIAQGRDVQFVSRQLGHTKTSTTWDTYVHLFEAHRHAHDAREQLDAEYGGMLGAADA